MLRSELKAIREAEKEPKQPAKGGTGSGVGRDSATTKPGKPQTTSNSKAQPVPKSSQQSARKKDAKSPPQSGSKTKNLEKASAPTKGMLLSLLDGPDKDSSKSRGFSENRRKLIKKVVKSLTESYSISVEQAEEAAQRFEKAICTAIDQDQRISDTDTAVRCYSNKIIELITEIKSGTVELQKFISKQEDATR